MNNRDLNNSDLNKVKVYISLMLQSKRKPFRAGRAVLLQKVPRDQGSF